MKSIIYYISIILVIGFFLYIAGILGLFEFIIFMFFYSLIFYGIYYIYLKIRKKEILSYKNFTVNFVKKSCLSITILVMILGIFGYYENNISPAKMTEYTISNGEKTVIFQEMSHIGSKNFYEIVKNNLTQYKKDGFVYFFEGVKPGTEENMDKFNKAIGIKFDKNLYENFSKLYGVTFQDNSIYLNLVNNLDFNVDVGIDWIIDKYETENLRSGILSPLKEKETIILGEKGQNIDIIDVNTEIINTLAKLNEKQLKILVFINKAILNALIKSDKAQDLISDNFANKQLFEIILDGRNKIISKEIQNSSYNNIYITYGKLHFDGVLKLLQQNDKNWKIINQKEIISMK